MTVSPPSRAMRLAPALLVAIACGAWGCYRPSITDGGLICAPASPFCPSGFSCVDNHCYVLDGGADRHPGDAPPDQGGAGGAGGQGALHDAGVEAPADATACVPRQPAAACTPDPGLACDPVCQSGCCTTEKCTALNSAPAGAATAALGCVAGSWLRDVGDTCDVKNAGTAQRSDNCLPGLLCVAGDTDAICLKLCRGDADCTGGATCQVRHIEPTSLVSTSVCGLPAATCTPTGATAGCPAGRTCYLIPAQGGAVAYTVCDISSGEGGNGSSCKFPFDCLPGWTCPASGAGAGRCQPACVPGSTTLDNCPRGLACQTSDAAYDICL